MTETLVTIGIAVISSGLLLGLFQLWVGRDGRRATVATTLVGGAHDVVDILREELEEERERRREAVGELAERLDAVEADLRDAHDENRRLRRALLQIRDWLRTEYDHSLDFTDLVFRADLTLASTKSDAGGTKARQTGGSDGGRAIS